MSYWDSSALIKLYIQEFDSAAFRALAANATKVRTASLTRHEMRTVFRRREAEGILPSGEAAVLCGELNADIVSKLGSVAMLLFFAVTEYCFLRGNSQN